MFCSKCGSTLPEEANFCLKCGSMTTKGVETGVSTPWEDMKEALHKMGQEMEKTLSIAGKEMEKALKRTRDEVKKLTSKKVTVCPQCKEKNFTNSNYCYKCGKDLKS